jgi:uncharacterized protein involved in cysteine biosynthesis
VARGTEAVRIFAYVVAAWMLVIILNLLAFPVILTSHCAISD